MTWTYTNNPAAVPIDNIRLLIGDTISTDPLFSNEELQWFIDDNPGSIYFAAASAADSLAGKYSRMVDKSIGRTSISYGQKAKQFATLAAKLRSKSYTKTNFGTPYCSTAETTLPSTDDLAVPAAFIRNQYDYEGTAGNDPEDLRDHYVP